MYIAEIGEDDTVLCAGCEANWSLDLLVLAYDEKRLRSMGFAYIWFDDGAICVNRCPHCELPILEKGTDPWASMPLYPSL
jgi:hypothetical protein